MVDRSSGTWFIPRGQVEIATKLVEDYERMLAVAPDYRGPRGFGRADVETGLTAVRRMIAQAEAMEAEEAPDALPAPPEGLEKRASALLAFYKSTENAKLRDSCILGRAAVEAGAAELDADLPGRVDDLCARAATERGR
jgi:hypothetical protein